jgi:hypothetical protein
VNIQKVDRFPAHRGTLWRPEPTDEMVLRLRNDVIENRQQLNGADLDTIYDVFMRCSSEHGIDNDEPYRFRLVPSNVRYNSCIVIDGASLRSLHKLPENPPDDINSFARTPGAWVWVLSDKTIEQGGAAFTMQGHVVDG